MRELILQSDADVKCEEINSFASSGVPGTKLPEYCLNSNFRLVKKILEKITHGEKFYSLEFFPQQHVQLKETLLACVGRSEPPLFCSVTWHVKTPLAVDHANIPALQLGSSLSDQSCVLLHVAAAGLTEADVYAVLHSALLQGVNSLLLLRGDGEKHIQSSFTHAVDLVRFVRREFGQLFTVFVAGYPDGHPEATSYHQDLLYLKDKVDAGADGIISQVVFDVQKFASFVQDCRDIGISVPVLPGVMIITSYKILQRASHICKFNIPSVLCDALQLLAEDSDAVVQHGLHYTCQLVRELLALNCVHGIHFFTMNRPQLAVEIWQRQHLANPMTLQSYEDQDEKRQPEITQAS